MLLPCWFVWESRDEGGEKGLLSPSVRMDVRLISSALKM